MPRIVDHEERRRSIASGAVAAIADVGLDVKLMDIGSAAGCTTGAGRLPRVLLDAPPPGARV